MKIRINTEIIKGLKPCRYRMDNWREHYNSFDGDIIEFLELDKITHSDKLWVTVRLISQEMRVVFALDCAFSATDSVAAYYAVKATDGYADYAAAYAVAYSAAYSADYFVDYYPAGKKQEKEHQIEALIYLIQGEK